MKKTLIAATIAVVAPFSAQADLLFTVGAKGSVWQAEPTGQIDDGVSVEDDGLNLDDENGQQITVFFEHPVPFVPNVQIRQTSLDLSGEGSVDVRFADTNFNENVSSKIDLSHTDLTLYWGLPLPLPFIDIDLGVTGRQFDGFAEVRGETTNTYERVDLDVPMAALYGGVKVNTPFGVYANADINWLGFGGNKMIDTSYVLGYTLPIPVIDLGLEAGYRSLSMQTDSDDYDIDTDVDVSGMFYGASLSVGF